MALIYREDGRLLMRLSDDASSAAFPGCWSLVGGRMRAGESPEQALARELRDVIDVSVAPGPEAFSWRWRCSWISTTSHFFPVRCAMDGPGSVQPEGEMAWMAIEDLVELPLTPDVYENFSKIATLLDRERPHRTTAIEKRLLAVNNLVKKNDRVFYASENPCALSRQQMFLLKELACLRGIPTFRVCLHTDDQSDIHEMVMVHTAPTSVGPLKQRKTSLSYHVFEGSLTIKRHDEVGCVLSEQVIGEGKPSQSPAVSVRLNATEFRSVHSTSPYCIFLEVASGPFQDSDTVWLDLQS